MNFQSETRSIQQEISRGFSSTNVTALLVACLCFLVFDVVTYRRNLSLEAETRGRIIAANCTSSLAFENQEDADEIISALREDPQIIAAALYRRDGSLFTAYRKGNQEARIPSDAPEIGTSIDLSRLDVVLPVREGDATLGRLLIRASLSEFYTRLRLFALIGVVVFLLALLVGRWASNLVGRRIARPVLDLAETTRRIADGKDYSVRAEMRAAHATTELIELTDWFNFMLAQIEERDRTVRSSEERFRTIFDFAPFGAAELDDAGMVIRSNRALHKMLARDEELLQAHTLWTFAFDEDIAEQEGRFQSLIQGSADHFELESRFLRPDRSVVWSSFAVSVIRGGDGLPKTIIAMLRDITREKQAEKALRESEENLQDLVYIASHDLQTPVVSLVGFSSQILRQHGASLDERGRHALHRLKANSERLHALILSLLDLSRLNTVKHPHRTFSVQRAVESTISDLDLKVQEGEASVSVGDLPNAVGDESRLTSVFRNLLSNALKYGGKQIDIGFAGGAYYVRDNGIGITERNLVKVFNAGVRLKTVDVDGVGMGLTFCRKVVAQHGGRIWVESDGKGMGSTFFFTLSEVHSSTLLEKGPQSEPTTSTELS